MAETESSLAFHQAALEQELQVKIERSEYTPAELTKLFDTYKKQGDSSFKTFNYDQAIHFYSLALICHEDTVTFANRSLAHFKLENYVKALSDGECSIRLDRRYIKGYYRIGVCQMALQNYALAISAFTQLLELQPNEVGARQQLLNARKAFREQQYALAIGGGAEDINNLAVKTSIFDRLNFDLPIPQSYNGPLLDTSIKYMEEGLYADTVNVRQTDDLANGIRLHSQKYTLEFVNHIVYSMFAHEQAPYIPRAYIYHILKDFCDLMRSLPTVIDYDVPVHNPMDLIDSDDTEDAEEDTNTMENSDGENATKPTTNNDSSDKMTDSPATHDNTEEQPPQLNDDMGDDDSATKTSSTDSTEPTDSTTSTASEKPKVKKVKPPKPVPKTIQPATLIVCGDTHGQFWDLLNIFKLHGAPSIMRPYLFNGDFVDRGSFGYELVLTLMLYKLHCPLAMHMTRGNHETINMNRSFGFYGEVLHKADLQTFDCFTSAFNALPLAYVLGKKVLILHGGLFSDEKATLNDLRSVDRFRQPPEHGGLMVDCLWSDPHAFIKGRRTSVRGAGCQFGMDITANWLHANGLELLVRSHEMKQAGFEVTHGGKLVTIFSAPNYVDTMGNKGALMLFDSNYTYQFHQFEAVQHPPVRAMHFADPFLR